MNRPVARDGATGQVDTSYRHMYTMEYRDRQAETDRDDYDDLLGPATPEPFRALDGLPRWIAWRAEPRGDKLVKTPRDPHTGGLAAADNLATWATRERTAARAQALGAPGHIGLILGPGAPGPCIGGVDLDGCRDPETGEIEPWAAEIVDRFGSYAEVSPSGAGLKAFFEYDPADLDALREAWAPVSAAQWGPTADADHHGPALHLGGRWYAVTGDHHADSPGEIRPVDAAALRWLACEIIPAMKAAQPALQRATGESTPGGRSERLMSIASEVKAAGGDFDAFKAAAEADPEAWAHVEAQGRSRARARALRRAWDRTTCGYIEPDAATIAEWIAELEDLPDVSARVAAVRDAGAPFLFLNDKGKPVKSQHNAVALLDYIAAVNGVRLRRNVLSGRVEQDDRNLTDRDLTLWRMRLEHKGLLAVDDTLVRKAVYEVADREAYHPVREHLDALPEHDKKARLDTWLTDYLGVADSAYTRAVGRKFLVAMVARAMLPGCKFDNVLVLGGKQGVGKSTVCAILADRPEWFLDALPDIGKDGGDPAMKALRGKWVVEVGELVAVRKAEQEDLKAFITRQVDEYRLAYAVEQTAAPRQCVMIGTTNKREFLRDDTGDRRYWPVWCEGSLKLDSLKADRAQLFAEALVAFKLGEAWHLDRETEALARDVQATYAESDPWEDRLQAYLANKADVRITDVLWDCLGVPVERQNRVTQNRVASTLRRLGWEKGHTRAGKVWRPGDADIA